MVGVDSLSKTIEKLDARKVINGTHTNWTLIKLQFSIKSRAETLVSVIDDSEIAILGGRDKNFKDFGEVLLFDTKSNKA